MRIGHFLYKNNKIYGLVEGERVYIIEGNIFSNFKITKNSFNINEAKFLPVVYPSKIIAVGLNYKDHAKELNMQIPDEPIIFLKPPTSVIGHLENIKYPEMSKRVDFEAELGIIIKEKIYKVKEKEASDYILGYTCANDVTARDLQKKDGQWTRAKSFDTFCPIGPFIYIPEKNENFDPHNLKIQTFVNDKIKQDSNTSNLIFRIEKLINFISNVMTLYEGDVIITGTPPGIDSVLPGDRIDIVIEKIGKLTNFVVE